MKNKRNFLLGLSLLVLLALCGCGKNDNAEKKEWTDEKIENLFVSKIENKDWDIIDCEAVSDSAFGRVGAILFVNNETSTTHVAFMSEDGNYQMCTLMAQLYSEPEFKYIGDGAVTFKMQSFDGSAYGYKISFSEENGNVNFKAEVQNS